MNTTLAVVVSAIVILITALVVITIFSGGVGQVGSMTNSQSVCQTQARSSCYAACSLPLTWSVPTVTSNGKTESCFDATGGSVTACGGLSGLTKPTMCADAVWGGSGAAVSSSVVKNS